VHHAMVAAGIGIMLADTVGHGAKLMTGLRRRVSDRLRVLFTSMCCGCGRHPELRGGASRASGGHGSPGRDRSRGIRSVRRASRRVDIVFDPRYASRRLHLGLQARPLLAGAGDPGAGDRQCPARLALRSARFRHTSAARGKPRLPAGAPPDGAEDIGWVERSSR